MVHRRPPTAALKFCDDLEFSFTVFVGRRGRLKIARDWPGHSRRWALVRAIETARRNFRRRSHALLLRAARPELHSPRQHGRFRPARPPRCRAPSGSANGRAAARQHFAVGVEKESVASSRRCGVDVHPHAGLRRADRRTPAMVISPSTKSVAVVRHRQRVPAQLIRRAGTSSKGELRSKLLSGSPETGCA